MHPQGSRQRLSICNSIHSSPLACLSHHPYLLKTLSRFALDTAAWQRSQRLRHHPRKRSSPPIPRPRSQLATVACVGEIPVEFFLRLLNIPGASFQLSAGAGASHSQRRCCCLHNSAVSICTLRSTISGAGNSPRALTVRAGGVRTRNSEAAIAANRPIQKTRARSP